MRAKKVVDNYFDGTNREKNQSEMVDFFKTKKYMLCQCVLPRESI